MRYYVYMLLIVLVAAIPIFAHLDTLPVQPYDEARLAVNSLEMSRGQSNILIPTYGGKPDMWNTKPPLLIWMQALSYKIFGVNELALRLPTAFAALATCILLYWFCYRFLKRPLLGICAVAILITSEGYVRIHGIRTGDYDAMLTLFSTAYVLFFYSYLSTRKAKYIYYTCVALILAILTKGIAALFFLPALFLFTILFKQYRFIFRLPAFYSSIIIVILTTSGYYMLREQLNPGYVQAVLANEVGGRFNTVVENHTEDKWYYFGWLVNEGFRYWILLLPFGLIAGLLSTPKKVKHFTLFLALLIIVHFAVITTAQTKINWYDIPQYPFLSLLAGLFIYYCAKAMFVKTIKQHCNATPYLFIIFIFIVPYYHILKTTFESKCYPWLVENMNIGIFLKDAREGKHSIKGYKIIWNCHEPNLYWYVLADGGKNDLDCVYEHVIPPASTAAVFKENTKKYVEMNYFSTVVRNYNGVTVYKIHGRKKENSIINSSTCIQ